MTVSRRSLSQSRVCAIASNSRSPTDDSLVQEALGLILSGAYVFLSERNLHINPEGGLEPDPDPGVVFGPGGGE